jgi:hypothetical protein
MPGERPWGGFVHDGCVVADDRGSGIRGRQLDLFAARESSYVDLSRHRLGHVTVYRGGDKCRHLDHHLAEARAEL